MPSAEEQARFVSCSTSIHLRSDGTHRHDSVLEIRLGGPDPQRPMDRFPGLELGPRRVRMAKARLDAFVATYRPHGRIMGHLTTPVAYANKTREAQHHRAVQVSLWRCPGAQTPHPGANKPCHAIFAK
jgi:hypothetical protein